MKSYLKIEYIHNGHNNIAIYLIRPSGLERIKVVGNHAKNTASFINWESMICFQECHGFLWRSNTLIKMVEQSVLTRDDLFVELL